MYGLRHCALRKSPPLTQPISVEMATEGLIERQAIDAYVIPIYERPRLPERNRDYGFAASAKGGRARPRRRLAWSRSACAPYPAHNRYTQLPLAAVGRIAAFDARPSLRLGGCRISLIRPRERPFCLSGRLDLNQRPFDPSRRGGGVDVSLRVPGVPCVPRRGHPGRMGRISRYHGGTTPSPGWERRGPGSLRAWRR